MLGRRSKRSIRNHFGEAIWPRSGWRRSLSYRMHRLARLEASSYTLAAGFACGAAVSFLPFLGLHFVLAAMLAFALRGSILAAALGTVIGNPWTFPFIWVTTYRLGRWLGFGGGAGAPEKINFGRTLVEAVDAVWQLDMTHLAHAVWPVVKPMTLGGVLLGAAAWLTTYLLLNPVLRAYKEARSRRLERGQARAKAKRADEVRLEKVETS